MLAAEWGHGRRRGWLGNLHPGARDPESGAFEGVQASPRYSGGLALRFARVKCYRPDRTAAGADTIDRVRALHRA